MIHTENLGKQYGTFTALRDCSVDISPGEIVGLLGPNGAGKTTLIRILLGFLHPSSGSAQIAGWDCTQQSLQARRHVAYVPGNVRLMGRMRVRECLAFLAGLRHPNRRAEAWRIADRLELPLHTRIAYLSTGMRQKLALCAALSAAVPVMILDEPTANLDPSVRQEVLQLVREAQRGGQTVIFSSHVLSEVEEICERVLLLRAGELVHTQCMSELRRGHRIRARGAGFPANLPEALTRTTTVEIDRDEWVQISAWGALSPVLQWIAPFNLDEIYVEPMGLRAVYEQFFPCGNLQPCGRQ